ncbi:MAG: hypothetical protein CYG60_02970 [Actinobacteria bacterium]|nr:MAG: hypothetical protein CYG60_02970 [Actinomycetota bacterium]
MESGDQLVLATDSLITGGFEYPHGTKLLVLDRGDCGLCWEGSTAFTYSFTENARVDIDFSDSLNSNDKPLIVLAKRITKVFNDLWQANLNDSSSMFKDEEFSFIFGGYCPNLKRIQSWHIRRKDNLRGFSPEERRLSLGKPCFVGSGAVYARAIFQREPGISPYQVLLRVIEDDSVRDVGGIPQLVTIDENGVEVVGVIKDGARYLFGRRLNSTGHKTKVKFIPYDTNEF